MRIRHSLFVLSLAVSAIVMCAASESDSCVYTFNVPHEEGCSVMDGTVSQLTTTVNELQAQVTSLLQQNTGLLQHNIQLLQDNAYWRQVVEKKLQFINDSSPRG